VRHHRSGRPPQLVGPTRHTASIRRRLHQRRSGITQRTTHGEVPVGLPDPTPLSEQTLALHAGRVRVPSYDRAGLTPAVVHFSVGGFHRAHQLVYFDDLAESGDTGWGVVGVGLHSPEMRDALRPQDHLYTVVERSVDGEHARVIGSMVDYHFAPDSP
jgi:mannitol 2-dehydrogenase